jgi:hypothetical protein
MLALVHGVVFAEAKTLGLEAQHDRETQERRADGKEVLAVRAFGFRSVSHLGL